MSLAGSNRWSTPHSGQTSRSASIVGTAARSVRRTPPWPSASSRAGPLRHLVWAPNELGFARAYVAGDVQIEGDLLDAMTRLEAFGDPERGPGVHVGHDTVLAVAKAAVRLGALGPRPRPPAEEIRLSGQTACARPGRSGDLPPLRRGQRLLRAGARPLDGLLLRLLEQPPSADYTLEDAQRGQARPGRRKLGSRAGRCALLDVGCGWGAFAIHAASRVRRHGPSASRSPRSRPPRPGRPWPQLGLADRVEIRVQDYRDVADGPYDAIASIGMAEHVGLSELSGYAAHLHDLLAPGGRLLNHAISRRPGPPDDRKGDRTSFIDRYVFPDGELHPLATTVDVLESAGFEVRDVESLREHYADTLRAWVANLERALGRGGPALERRSGAGVAALHGRVGAGVPVQPPRHQPGAGRQARDGWCERSAAHADGDAQRPCVALGSVTDPRPSAVRRVGGESA